MASEGEPLELREVALWRAEEELELELEVVASCTVKSVAEVVVVMAAVWDAVPEPTVPQPWEARKRSTSSMPCGGVSCQQGGVSRARVTACEESLV